MLEKEEERAKEGEHRVCASGTGRQGKIAWARLAGRVCLCLIEEGCETETPHWLGFTGMLPWRDGRIHTSTHFYSECRTWKKSDTTWRYKLRKVIKVDG